MKVPLAKLFIVTLHRDQGVLRNAIRSLQEHCGNVDYESSDFPFTVTDYYKEEMGEGLVRRFFSFAKLIEPDQLVSVKLLCNKIEFDYSVNARRSVNLDPGYIDHYKLVLASNKYGGQKIYLREGVYADMTLFMYKGRWESFAWGFPDFKSGIYNEALSNIRERYKADTKTQRYKELKD